MEEKMKVHAYRVMPADQKKTEAVEAVLTKVHKKPIEARIRTLSGGTEVRLEDFQKARGGYYLMDFTLFRFKAGPGKAARNSSTAGFTFADGEAFGEETGALYDPATGCLLVQYNHHGVRAGRIEEYLTMADTTKVNGYELQTIFDLEADSRFRKQKVMRSFTFKIAAREISSIDRKGGQSLQSSIDLGKYFGAETIEVTVRTGRSKHASGLALQKAMRLATLLRERKDSDDSSVDSLKASGKQDPDAKSEMIDLLGQRLEMKFDDLKTGEDLRLPRNARWNALEQALRSWDRELKRYRVRGRKP